MRIRFPFPLLALALASTLIAYFQGSSPELETAWVCPMHPDYTTEAVGVCPRCGMSLVRAAPFDVRDYPLEFTTVPAPVRPGQKASLFFRITHPETGQLVERFETVHERQFHLFVISQDMEHFEHIHPEQLPDGVWTIDVTLPKAGYYKVLSDFMPSGGSAQFLSRALVTAGYQGDLAGDAARLVADTSLTKTSGDLTATLSLDPPVFEAGLYGHLNFHLTDAATGRPVTDLQTYLGAFGHTLIMSEDMVDYVHSHPLDILAQESDDGGPPRFLIPPGADLEALRGGPDVTFEGLMPKPGLYRAWTQFRRNNRIHTFAFTFQVVSGGAP
jgi:catechol 2,3-dioxygenase-like lactoylglutathione lyase family enzyme